MVRTGLTLVASGLLAVEDVLRTGLDVRVSDVGLVEELTFFLVAIS